MRDSLHVQEGVAALVEFAVPLVVVRSGYIAAVECGHAGGCKVV